MHCRQMQFNLTAFEFMVWMVVRISTKSYWELWCNHCFLLVKYACVDAKLKYMDNQMRSGK